MRSSEQPRKSASATFAASATTCSQLSRITSALFCRRNPVSVSMSGRFGNSWTRSAVAIAATTSLGSASGASSTSHRPSSAMSPRAVPTSNAVRVLPTPPVPVRVTIRCPRTSATISPSSESRPTKLVSAKGRLLGRRVASLSMPGRRAPGRVAAASNARRCSGPSVSASSRRMSVSRCGVRRSPRSSAPTPFALIRARSASASCESPAASR